MGDPACQAPDRLHLLRHAERGHVARVEDDAYDPFAIEERARPPVERPPRAVFVLPARLERDRLPDLAHDREEPLGRAGDIVGVGELEHALADELPLLVPEDLLERRVRVAADPLMVDDRDRVRGALHDRAEELLALAQRLFGDAPRGHVPNHADAADHVPASVPKRGVVAVVVARHPVAHDGVVLDDRRLPRERAEKEVIDADLSEVREDLERIPPEDLRGRHPGAALHRRIPERVATLAIEGDEAIDAALNERLGEGQRDGPRDRSPRGRSPRAHSKGR